MRTVLVGVRLALRAIRRNVLRSVLTVLGILIGVAAVVIVTALGTGARASVAKQIESIGSNFILIYPQNASASGARGMQGSGTRLTEDDGRAILRESVSVAAVSPALRARAQVVAGERNWSTSVTGVSLPFFEIRNWKTTSGGLWTRSDESTKAKVCVIGRTVKERLFGDSDAVGRSVRIGRYVFRVLGVLDTKGEAAFGGDQDDVLLMPIGSMRARVMRTAPGFAGVLMLSSTSAETTDRAVQQADAILRQRHRIGPGREPDFGILTQKQFQQMQSAIYGVLTMLLIAIAAISLVVGGIGIMNIMLVNVTERTREIGIRMAIGAREGDIRTQFLVEAVVLSVLGGLVGVGVGLAAIWGLGSTLGWPMEMSGVALSLSLGTSAATGIAFGFFPARRAAKLDPIVALRHE
jgi:putative ABC transport system permease protein